VSVVRVSATLRSSAFVPVVTISIARPLPAATIEPPSAPSTVSERAVISMRVVPASGSRAHWIVTSSAGREITVRLPTFSTGEAPQSVIVRVAAGALVAVRSTVAPSIMAVNGRMASSPLAGRRSWRRGGWCASVTRRGAQRMRGAGWRPPAALR
jgi:hypothetical protein